MKKIIFTLSFMVVALSNFAQLTYKDVAPIFYSRCTSCHHKGIQAPYLTNYATTFSWRFTIANNLTINRMPPWPPDTTYSRFLHENKITPSEKALIQQWVTQGAAKGDTTQAPPVPYYTPYKLTGTPNLILSIPTFTSNAFGQDSYVCFSLPTGLTQDRILRAYEVIAGNPSIVHHVVANIDTNGITLDDLSGSCYNISGDYSIGGYAPGSPPTVFPGQGQLKMGIKIKAGSRLVLQIHYPVGSAGQVDSTKIRLFFYPLGTTGVRNVYVTTPLQNWTMNLPANTVKTYTAKCSNMAANNSTLSIFGTFPHSHKIATKIVNYAYSGIDTVPLIRINKWAFDQQGYYTFNKMPKVSPTYTIMSSHVYDNTTNNPNNPTPVQVNAGLNTGNEMLFDSFQWLIYQNGDETIDVEAVLATDSLLQPAVASIKENHISMGDFRTYAYPNPSEGSVKIGYSIDNPCKVSVDIYSVLGTVVKSVSSNFENIGTHEILWDGKNNAGINLPAGTYVYLVKAGAKQSYGKLTLLPAKN